MVFHLHANYVEILHIRVWNNNVHRLAQGEGKSKQYTLKQCKKIDTQLYHTKVTRWQPSQLRQRGSEVYCETMYQRVDPELKLTPISGVSVCDVPWYWCCNLAGRSTHGVQK
jgi:hypothetical protein